MSSSLILELSENGKNSNNYANGDYEVSIPPQLLEKNDQVVLKSAFIDSIQANPNAVRQITVPETVKDSGLCDIKVEFGYYYLDWGSVQETTDNVSKVFKKYQNQDKGIASAGNHIAKSGKPYILNYSLTDPHVNIKYMDTFTIGMSPPIALSGNRGRKELFQYNVSVEYDDWDEVNQVKITSKFAFSLVATKDEYKTYVPVNHEVNISGALLNDMNLAGILIMNDNISLPIVPLRVHVDVTAETVFKKVAGADNSYQSLINPIFKTLTAGDLSYQLYKQSINFQIIAKTYEAVDLASLISEKMTDFNAGGTAKNTKPYILSNNPLLKTIRQLMKNDDGGNYFSNTDVKKPAFFGTDIDGSYSSFKFETPIDPPADPATDQNFIIGSSDFALTYDEQHDKMVMLQYHNHLYSDDTAGGGLPQVRVYQTTESINTANRVGGVFLTGLSPQNLWYGPQSQFKFDESIICKPTTRSGLQTQADNTTVTTDTISFETFDLIEGVNCTADELGIDVFIQKTRTTITPAGENTPAVLSSGFDTVIPFSPATGNTLGQLGQIRSVSSNTINIRSAHTLLDTNDVNLIKKAGPYFKLEIGMASINQKLVGNTINNKIHSIISRFYQTGSYTSSYNEGSIPFIYNNDSPQLLTDFRVRILDDSGNVAKQLGNTSAIFMEIIKAQK